MTAMVSCDVDASPYSITWPKHHFIGDTTGIMWCWYSHQWCHLITKPCYTYFQLFWPKEYTGDIHDVVSIMWHWHWHQWHHMNKYHCALHLNNLDLRTAVVSLMIPSASCDTNASSNGVIWLEKSCGTSMWSPKECNGAIDFTIGIMWCWCLHQRCHMTNKTCNTSFLLFWHKECNGTIDSSISITWYWFWHQLCHMNIKLCYASFQFFWHKECRGDIDNVFSINKEGVLHFILIILK